MKIIFSRLLILYLFPMVVCAQQFCIPIAIDTAPDTAFIDNNDGTIYDKRTSLVWKKCSEGQSGNDCSLGAASTYSWTASLILITGINSNGGEFGYTDWRLPNRSELDTIIQRKCERPAINETYFPNSIGGEYWTSTPVGQGLNAAYVIDFWFGYLTSGGYDTLKYIRLMRGGLQ